MSTLAELKKEARQINLDVGRLTTSKDSDGEYTLYNDGYVVAEGYYDNAYEIKVDWLEGKIANVKWRD